MDEGGFFLLKLMKKFIFIFLVSFYSFGQSNLDRAIIISKYDFLKISNLKKEFSIEQANQEKLIRIYKNSNRAVDFSKKSLQRVYDGLPFYFSVDNAESAISMDALSVYQGGSSGLSLSGAGIVAGVWDGGKVRETHQEFAGGKIILGDGATSISDHGTHVTGTILSSGVDAKSKGIAFGAKAKTFFWDNDLTEMIQFASDGFLVSNHSYGYAITNLANSRFGAYDQSSRDYDVISETMPYYQIVKAAGNDRNLIHPQIIAKGGYDLLTGSALSKNVIVVAAVNHVPSYTGPGSVVISSFSNWGPTDDGRIKPDIAAKGLAVYSSIGLTNTSYNTLQGTSMAAPAIVGLICLMQEHNKNLNSSFLKAATVRGIICHTALETGNSIGPDYEYGWGLSNAREAIKVISTVGTNSIIKEQSLLDNTSFSIEVSITSAQPLAVTIAWTDPPGPITAAGVEDSRAATLVNNLDLEVIKDGVVYFPWKLDPANISQPATRNSSNEVDNIEKVLIDNAQPGTYTIKVNHKGTLTNGVQDFSLIANAVNGLTLANTEFETNNLISVFPNPTQDVFKYDLPQDFNLKSIKIYDALGKLVKNVKDLSTKTVEVSELETGIYFVNFKSENTSITKKVVKQ